MERHSQQAELQRCKATSRDPITPNRDKLLQPRTRRPSPRRLQFANVHGAAQPTQGGAADEGGSTRHGGTDRDQAQRAQATGTAGRTYVSADTAPQRKGAPALAVAAPQAYLASCSLAQRSAGSETSGGEERNTRGVHVAGVAGRTCVSADSAPQWKSAAAFDPATAQVNCSFAQRGAGGEASGEEE